jgi:hypothetical protein
MSVDTPARIAILGAGPLGLEAALYARYLGYEVALFEQQTACGNFLQRGEELLPHSAGENRTSLGLAALRAQSEDFPVFDATAQETARSLAESYLLPLAATDLLADCLHLGQMIVRIERTDFPEEELATLPADDAPVASPAEAGGELEEYEELEFAPFELLVRLSDGTEQTQQAEVVIDTLGLSAATPISLDSLQLENQSEADAAHAAAAVEWADFQTAEPNYYRLGSSGSASDVRNTPAGHEQIRRLFAVIGGRADLNLYATFKC